MHSGGGYQDWYVGLGPAAGDVVRAQMTSIEGGVDRVNDSAVRILHMARVLRKVAVGT